MEKDKKDLELENGDKDKKIGMIEEEYLGLKPEDVPAYALPYVKRGPLNVKEFGEWLKALREEKGLTLAELSEKTGYSTSHISQYETGKRKTMPKPEYLEKMSLHLGVSYSDLLYMAGYKKLADKMRFVEAVNEFSYDESKNAGSKKSGIGDELIEYVRHVTDIRRFLMNDFWFETTQRYVFPSYNGFPLKREDRIRAITVLDALFPEYIQPRQRAGRANRYDNETKKGPE